MPLPLFEDDEVTPYEDCGDPADVEIGRFTYNDVQLAVACTSGEIGVALMRIGMMPQLQAYVETLVSVDPMGPWMTAANLDEYVAGDVDTDTDMLVSGAGGLTLLDNLDAAGPISQTDAVEDIDVIDVATGNRYPDYLDPYEIAVLIDVGDGTRAVRFFHRDSDANLVEDVERAVVVSDAATSIALGDVNGDEVTDLVVGTVGDADNAVTVYLGPSFAAPVVVHTGVDVRDLVVGERDELAVELADAIFVLTNNAVVVLEKPED